MSGSRKDKKSGSGYQFGKVNDGRASVSKTQTNYNISSAASFKDNRTSSSSIQDKNSSSSSSTSSSSNIQDSKSSATPDTDTKSSAQLTNVKDNATSANKGDAPK